MSVKKVFGLIIVLAVSAIGAFATLNSNQSQAANMADFKAGNIISDAVFTNNNSMSANDIQIFLDSKNSCLKDRTWPGLYDLNGNGLVEDSGAEYYGVKGTMTSAQVIKAAADIYRINPQVILVILQKESSIITGSCTYINTAMGAACPDGAPCDDTKKGFVTQVDYGASYLRGYMNGRTNYPVGTNYIRYSPSASCGGSYVYIENLATGALYTYTPYQPNAGALAAYPGEAYCGAYGNRNFFAYFTDWFGSTSSVDSGAILARYNQLSDSLGQQVGSMYCPRDDTCWQRFDYGYIIWNRRTGAWESKGSIRKYWAELGYQDGKMGYPTGPEEYDEGTKTYSQTYENGIIYCSEGTTWHLFL